MEGQNALKDNPEDLPYAEKYFENISLSWAPWNVQNDMGNFEDYQAREIQKYLLRNVDTVLKAREEFPVERVRDFYDTLNIFTNRRRDSCEIDLNEINQRFLESTSNIVKCYLDNSLPQQASKAIDFIHHVIWEGRCYLSEDWDNLSGDAPTRTELFEKALEYCADSIEEEDPDKTLHFISTTTQLKDEDMEFSDLSGEHERAVKYLVENHQKFDLGQTKEWKKAIHKLRNLIDPDLPPGWDYRPVGK
ncbi:MAG: hypothetical protein ABEK36_03195 [Candidatus Aenigmatarchaeota archaeon]